MNAVGLSSYTNMENRKKTKELETRKTLNGIIKGGKKEFGRT